MLAIRNNLQGSLKAQWRDNAQDFRRHRSIDTHIAERDALSPSGVVDIRVVADIASDAAKPVVLNLQLSPAVPTPEQPRENPAAIAPDPTYADAILDRLVHNAYRSELRGESMRRAHPITAGMTAKK